MSQPCLRLGRDCLPLPRGTPSVFPQREGGDLSLAPGRTQPGHGVPAAGAERAGAPRAPPGEDAPVAVPPPPGPGAAPGRSRARSGGAFGARPRLCPGGAAVPECPQRGQGREGTARGEAARSRGARAAEQQQRGASPSSPVPPAPRRRREGDPGRW